MPYENIIFEREGEIATITINREKVRNALNQAIISEIYAALRVVEEDEELRAAIITGASDQPSPPAEDKR